MKRYFREISQICILVVILLLLLSISISPVLATPNSSSRQDENQAPVAEITAPKTGDMYEVNDEITFDGSSSYDLDNDTLSYSWNFGDGNSGSGKITSHSYAVPFVYVIRLTVSDGELNDTSTPVIIIVGGGGGQNQPPSAEISSPTSGDRYNAYETVYFDGSTSSDPEEEPLTFNWDFGDGNSSDQATTSHEYGSTGNYIVTLTVNDGMYNDSARILLLVDNTPPIADAGKDQETYSGQEITFDGSNSTDPDPTGRIVNWTWDFGNMVMGYGEIIAYTYFDSNAYTITLTVRDNDNTTDTDTVNVIIYNAKPVAMLSASPTSTMIGEDIEFDASDSYDVDGFIKDYYYNFGDGYETGWVSNVVITHSYSSPGVFNVTLKVRDNEKIQSELVNTMVQITTEPSEPPKVQITYPSNDENVKDDIKIEGTASAQEVMDIRVQVQIDDSGWGNATVTTVNSGDDITEVEWFYFWNTESVSDGEHSIQVRAYDGFQYSKEAKIYVNVINVAVQSITLTLEVKPSQAQPREIVTASGEAEYDTGVTVSGTNVNIEVVGLSQSYRATTDSKGRYSEEITAPSEPGRYFIKATITDGTFTDTIEKTLMVLNPPDLTLTEEDITFSKTKLVLGDKIKITVKIYNNGDMDGTGTVELYEGDPAAEGKLIKANSITVPALETATTTITWAPKTAGERQIYVIITGVTPTESNTANNHASKKIDVPAKPDEEEETSFPVDIGFLTDFFGGFYIFIGVIVGGIIVAVIVIAVVVTRKRQKTAEKEEKPEDARKPPPSSEETVIFTG